jgi:hypothetical protein
MNFRDPALLGLGALGAGIVFLPGRGLMGPALWFGAPHLALLLPLAALIFCVLFFGTLKFWKMLTGDSLQKPLPAVLALALAIRLTVDCARMLMWR